MVVASGLRMEMIFTAPFIITMEGARPIICNGGVAVRGSRIVGCGAIEELTNAFRRYRRFRLQNAVLLPGLVNSHTHLELPPLLEQIRAPSFPEWVLNLIQAKKSLNRMDYEAAAEKNIKTLIETGTTTVGEICTHGVSPALLFKMGIRSVVFHEIIHMGPVARGHQAWLSKSRRPGCILRDGLSPHTPYTVSADMLRRINQIARKKRLSISMHVSESIDEVRLMQGRKSGFEKLYELAGWDTGLAPRADSPIRYLSRLGLLNRRFLAVHAVMIDNHDISILKKAGVSIAHCPRSNRETHAGKMPLNGLMEAGINIGLGTDSLASSPSLSMWDEMRYCLKLHRRAGISPVKVLEMATISGARALGLEREAGSISVGKKADIIAVPLPGRSSGDLYEDLLRETGYCIMSMINGKIVMMK